MCNASFCLFFFSHLSSPPPSSSLLRFSSPPALVLAAAFACSLLGARFRRCSPWLFFSVPAAAFACPLRLGARVRRQGLRCTLVNSAGVVLFVSGVAPFPSCGAARRLRSTPPFWRPRSSVGVRVSVAVTPRGVFASVPGPSRALFSAPSAAFSASPLGVAVFVRRDCGLQKSSPRGLEF